jgi:hypothetical protein
MGNDMMLTAALLALVAAQANDDAIVVSTTRWAPFISPMGEPFRPGTDGQDTLATWFHRADANRDGYLSQAEVEADAMHFFARLDENEDGGIDPPEMNRYEWDIARDVQVTTRRRPAPGEDLAKIKKAEKEERRLGYSRDKRQGAARYALLNMPQPVAAADSDFNRLVTAAEFRAAAAYRFTLLDRNRTGLLTLTSLARMLAEAKTKDQKKKLRGEDDPDSRIGNPMQVGRQ